jgi:O-antigen biosynthesis protein
MMHPSVMRWVADRAGTKRYEKVLEVGSADVNGSVRPIVAWPGVTDYTGIDVVGGTGVDLVYDGEVIPFDDDTFDLVVSTEMLEHCQRPWASIGEMARVAASGADLWITARGWVHDGIGTGEVFVFHNPPDLWRFSREALIVMAEDAGLIVETVDRDEVPGWLMACVKP